MPSTTALSTHVERAKDGDVVAFRHLVETHANVVTAVAYGVLGNIEDSEDVGQKAFLEAWRNLSQLGDPGKFSGWICSIARNRAIDTVRKKNLCQEAGSLDHAELVASTEDPVDRQVEQAEEREILWSCLQGLPDRYRETMILYYRTGQSVQQVSEALDASPSAIRQRLVRGRNLVQKAIESKLIDSLAQTAPKAAFTAVVIGSLAGHATATAASTAAIASGGKGTAALSSGAALGSAFTGAFAGLLGGGIGWFFSHRSAPYRKQKRLITQTGVFVLLWSIVLMGVIYFLAQRQFTDDRVDKHSFAVLLLSFTVGFQALLAIALGWFTYRYYRLQKEARAGGEPIDPVYAKRLKANPPKPARYYTSRQSLLGLPLVDVQFGAQTFDRGITSPRIARGWVAIGDRAHGIVLAIGSRARGMIAFGGFACGVIAMGGVAIGMFTLGGCSLGLLSFGGLAFGGICYGGFSVGAYAVGGLAVGWVAVGGAAFGWKIASGGIAWSRGHAEGATILDGLNGEEISQQIESNWFVSLVNQMSNQIGGEASMMTMHQLNLALCIGTTAILAGGKFLYHTAIIPRLVVDDRQRETLNE